MDGATVAGTIERPTQTVATVIYAAGVLGGLERDCQQTPDSAAAILSAVSSLAAHPLLGRPIEGNLRELVISYGRTGHVALYRFVALRDEVRVLALRTQRELGFVP